MSSRVAIITGSSRGIGAATARLAAKSGYAVCVNYLRDRAAAAAVVDVRPGIIYTGIHADGGEPGRVDRLKDSVPMRRGGQPIEVARAILWLLSGEASYSTGTFLDVSGGR